jgi:hypothetical protein
VFGDKHRDPRSVRHGYRVGEHYERLSIPSRLLESTIERFLGAQLDDQELQAPRRRNGFELFRLVSMHRDVRI